MMMMNVIKIDVTWYWLEPLSWCPRWRVYDDKGKNVDADYDAADAEDNDDDDGDDVANDDDWRWWWW